MTGEFSTPRGKRLGDLSRLRRGLRALIPALCLMPLVAAANVAPVVDSFTADPPTVAPGGSLALRVEAHDPDCVDVCTDGCGVTIRDDLLEWSATAGTFLNPASSGSGSPYWATVTWEAPASEGSYTVTVDLADSGTLMCGGRMTASANLDVLVSSDPNLPPVVDSVIASPVRMFPDEVSQLSCSATDPEGDPVTYGWTSDAGSVIATGAQTAEFTAVDAGVATITCEATDSNAATGRGTVLVTVSGAEAEAALDQGLVAPHRLGVTTWGDVYAADRSAGGITAVNLFSGEMVHRLVVPGVRSVAVDWNDELVVATDERAQVVDRHGIALLALEAGQAYGRIADVATSFTTRRYGVLYRKAGRVVVFDVSGTVVASFGSTGDGPEQFKSPSGLAATPNGGWVVADSGHGLVKVFDGAGALVSSFGGLGGGVGEFVKLDDVAVDGNGLVYASDAFQSWVQVFNVDGSPREVLGTYGSQVGEFMTAGGLAVSEAWERLAAASPNSSSVQILKLSAAGGTPPPQPIPQLSAAQLSFADQPVGTASAIQTVTISNAGTAPLGLRDLAISGAFSGAHTCGSFLDPGASCDVLVSFEPTALGASYGELYIDNSTGVPMVVSLVGTGVIPSSLWISPGGHVFLDRAVGTVSPPQTFTLGNSGTEELLLSSVTASVDFALTNHCGGSISAGSSCNVEVSFAPSTSGDPVSGELRVVSSDVASPHAVNIQGRAVVIELTTDPSSLGINGVPVGQEAEAEVTFNNTGDDTVLLGAAAIVGTDAAEFRISRNECTGVLLPVAASCVVAVTYAPTSDATHEAELEIATDWDLTIFVPVLGNGPGIFSDGFETGDTSAWSPQKKLGLWPGDPSDSAAPISGEHREGHANIPATGVASWR